MLLPYERTAGPQPTATATVESGPLQMDEAIGLGKAAFTPGAWCIATYAIMCHLALLH